MDLGKAKLLRSGLNTLHQAIHPVHGIAWTDGKQVCLTSLFYVDGELTFGDTNVIGQFEHVLGLSWGPLCRAGSAALLAVQHKKHVTVWQLQLSALEQNKLLCTQTCELSEPLPLLSQGCVWHPKLDVLAVLTKKDASVLFAVRADNRRVRAELRTSGLVRCSCWTKDGTRLVVAIGSALHSYIWNDAQKSLVACSFCPVFDVAGSICAMEAAGEAQVAVSTELPLERLCGLNAGMAFDVSPPEQAPHAVVAPDDDACSDSRRRSFDSDRSVLSAPSGPVDLTHVLARHRASDPSPLVHLRRRDHLTGSGQDSSHLILVTYERKVTTTRKVCIPGILVPDIVTFDPRGSTVAVASNSCNMVLVYCVTASAMPNVQQISLQKSERPKGVCFLGDRTLLLMVGRQKTADPAFLPASNTDKYLLRIVVKELVYDGDTLAAGSAPPAAAAALTAASLAASLARGSPVGFGPGIRRHSEYGGKEERERGAGGIKDLVLPGGAMISTPSLGSRGRLVEEVSGSPEPVATASTASTTSSTASSDVPPDRASSSGTASSVTLENFDWDRVSRMSSLSGRGSARPCSPRCEPVAPATPNTSSLPRGERPAPDQLSHDMERIFSRFADMQQCLAEIRDYTRNGRKALGGGYPNACEPPYVNITCQKQLSENVFIDERRPVLLCEGKLCLQVLRDLFSLSIVEMMSGPLWVVLVADAEGFVPLTFKPKEELTVRNGKRKCSVRPTGSPEESCPPSPVRPDKDKDDHTETSS